LAQQTLIIGNGPCAGAIICDLKAAGAGVILAVGGEDLSWCPHTADDHLEILAPAGIVGCRGSVGNFEVILMRSGDRISRAVDSIIVALEPIRTAEFSLYGLSESKGVCSLSRLLHVLEGAQGHPHRTRTPDLQPVEPALSDCRHAVFLTGLAGESNPLVAEETMAAALTLQQGFGVQTYVLTGNLKVADDGLESLCRDTKTAGTVYVKFQQSRPDMGQTDDGRAWLTFDDELAGQRFRLSPDLLVVDEVIRPAPGLKDLARILGIDSDEAGFVQSDNVHRSVVSTNRRGIFAAGASRALQSITARGLDGANAALAVHELRDTGGRPGDGAPKIRAGHCIRCLTCYRVCPHRAIQLNGRPEVMPEACEGCGICVAECPREAMTLDGQGRSALAVQATADLAAPAGESFVPKMVAFCCRRSAAAAAEQAACFEPELPKGLRVVEIPCAGGLSQDHILAAFKHRADGVLVLACHDGNCHSERGNRYARRRTEQIADLLGRIGFESDRLRYHSLAANMGHEFAETTRQFERRLLELGPSRLTSC